MTDIGGSLCGIINSPATRVRSSQLSSMNGFTWPESGPEAKRYSLSMASGKTQVNSLVLTSWKVWVPFALDSLDHPILNVLFTASWTRSDSRAQLVTNATSLRPNASIRIPQLWPYITAMKGRAKGYSTVPAANVTARSWAPSGSTPMRRTQAYQQMAKRMSGNSYSTVRI